MTVGFANLYALPEPFHATAVRRRQEPASVQLRILLIEDQPEEALRLRHMLMRTRNMNVTVETADRLYTGIERLALGGIDLVLLDLGLPDSEGLETFTSLSTAAPHLPIIVASSHSDESLAVQAVQQGAQDYIVKGHATPEGLARSIRCAIERNNFVSSLRGLSLMDELSGLFNRRGFSTLAAGHLRLGQRMGSRFLMIFADLDGLKQINDTYGHHEGDQAIMQMAEVLRQTFRQSDVVARFGGDEFAVLALDTSGDGDRIVRCRLEQSLEKLNAAPDRTYPLSCSLGIVPFEAGPNSPLQEIMAKADRVLYENKRARKLAIAGQPLLPHSAFPPLSPVPLEKA